MSMPPTAPAPAPTLPAVLTTPLSGPNGSPRPGPKEPRPRPNKLRRLLLAGAILAAVIAAGTGYVVYGGGKQGRTDLMLHKVGLAPIRLTVVERGALESADNREVTCRVKMGTRSTDLRIKWVIDDGAQVKQGERLMEIEDSALQDQLKSQRIILDQAKAAMIAAEENFKIVVSQNGTNVRTAHIGVELAKLDLEKYEKGEYPQQLKDIQGRIKVAEADRDIQKERTAWAERMKSRDYYSQSQFNSEESRLRSLELAAEKVKEELRVLDYAQKRTMTDLQSKLAEAYKAVEREIDKAKAEEIKAESERLAKKSVYLQELEKYDDIEDQIRKCIITSPQDGMVVYYVSEQSRYGSGSQQSIIAQGEPVREGQKLMRIPDLRRMVVNAKVHEAMVSRIRGDVWQPTHFVDTLRAAMMFQPDALVRMNWQYAVPELRERLREHEMQKVADGMRATIRIEAFPDKLLQGHVKSVATVSAKQDWNSSDVKVYQTMIAIDESLEGLKPDMSAEVTILVEGTGESVLTVPLQAIFGGTELGSTRKVFVMSADRVPTERDVTIGLSNEKVVEIKEGLKEGEEVVLNPKAILGDKVKTRQVIEGNERGGPGGEGRGKGKGKGKSRGEGKQGPPGGMPPMDGPNGPGGPGGGGGMPPGGRMAK